MLLEFAIVTPLLFALVFGIIDFGSSYNDFISVRQGARDGARQSVTGRIGSDTDCPIAGTRPSGNTEKLVCLVKDRVMLDEADTRVKIDIEGTYEAKRSIAVCVMYETESITGFYANILDDRVMRTEVQMLIEQTVVEAGGTGVLADYEEPAITGSSWSFCAAGAT